MSVNPYLCLKGAADALQFYRQAFGAVESGPRITDADGRVGHSTISIGDSTLYISDEHPEIDVLSPESLGGSPVSLMLEVTDCDASYERAVAAGATVVTAPEDQFYGARSATVQDPFGMRWFLQTELEALDSATLQERAGSTYTVQDPEPPVS